MTSYESSGSYAAAGPYASCSNWALMSTYCREAEAGSIVTEVCEEAASSRVFGRESPVYFSATKWAEGDGDDMWEGGR